MRTGIIGLALLGGLGLAHAQDILGMPRSQFIEASKRECMVRQRQSPQNDKLSNEFLTRYCNCTADHMLEVLSTAELMRTVEKPIPKEVQRKLNAIGEACLPESVK